MKQILLDTCSLIWLANGESDRFSKQALESLGGADFLYISPMSEWEITFKWRNGGIVLPVPPRELIDTFMTQYGVLVTPLTEEIMFRAAELPLFHRDPADRFIIATALVGKMAVATADQRFSQYGVEVLI